MASTGEGNVKKAIKKWFAAHFPRAWGWMPVKTVHGVNGIPDHIYALPVEITEKMVGFTVSLFVGVEAKTKNGRQSDHQKDRQEDIETANGIYLMPKGVDAVDEVLSKLLWFVEEPMSEETINKIEVNSAFYFYKDKYQWVLVQKIPYEANGVQKTKVKKSFHANIDQICREIINRNLGCCETIEQMMKLLAGTYQVMNKFLKNKAGQ